MSDIVIREVSSGERAIFKIYHDYGENLRMGYDWQAGAARQ